MRFLFCFALVGVFASCGFAAPSILDSQLLHAASKSDSARVQALIKRGAHVNARDSDGTTALMFAAQRYNASLVDFLLKHGAGVHAVDKEGFTALGYGPSLAANLAPYEAKATPRDSGALSDSLENSIWIDSDMEDEDVKAEATLFLKLGMSLNTRGYDENGLTPLLNAVDTRSSLVRFLLDLGADPNLADKDGRTPLMAALAPDSFLGVERSNTVAMLLLQRGATLNNRDAFGETALMSAVQSNRQTLVQELLRRGANPNIRDKRGESALMRAATGGYPTIAHLLLKAVADTKLKDAKGQTALDYARSRQFEISSNGAVSGGFGSAPLFAGIKPLLSDVRLALRFKAMKEGRAKVLALLEGWKK